MAEWHTRIVIAPCDHHPRRGAVCSNLGFAAPDSAIFYYCEECAAKFLTPQGRADFDAAAPRPVWTD